MADLYARLQLVANSTSRTSRRRGRRSWDRTIPSRSTGTELLRRVQVGDVTVIDVRPGVEYSSGHIPGALSVPLSQLAARLAELPADQDIVAYCRGAYCVLSYDAVRLLHAAGRRALRLSDGMLEWRLAELPVAT